MNAFNLPADELGTLVNKLSPDERKALRYIAAYADVLMVQDTPYLLIQADEQLLDQLAQFEAAVDDIEPEDEGDELDTLEGNQLEDAEYDAQGFGNWGCQPGMEWWRDKPKTKKQEV